MIHGGPGPAAAILQHKTAVSASLDGYLFRRQRVVHGPDELQRQMLRPTQSGLGAENELTSRPVAIDDRQPSLSQHDLGEPNARADREPEDDESGGPAGHASAGRYERL
jgi:hypothetical protein